MYLLLSCKRMTVGLTGDYSLIDLRRSRYLSLVIIRFNALSKFLLEFKFSFLFRVHGPQGLEKVLKVMKLLAAFQARKSRELNCNMGI